MNHLAYSQSGLQMLLHWRSRSSSENTCRTSIDFDIFFTVTAISFFRLLTHFQLPQSSEHVNSLWFCFLCLFFIIIYIFVLNACCLVWFGLISISASLLFLFLFHLFLFQLHSVSILCLPSWANKIDRICTSSYQPCLLVWIACWCFFLFLLLFYWILLYFISFYYFLFFAPENED